MRNRFFKKLPLLIILFFFLGALLLWHSFHSPNQNALYARSYSHRVIQYVDAASFQSVAQQEQWLALLQSLPQSLPSSILLEVWLDPSMHTLQEPLQSFSVTIKLCSLRDDPFINHPLPPVALFAQLSKDESFSIVTPAFLLDLHTIAHSSDIFQEALLGASLDPQQIYLFSRFDQGRFRVVPQLLIALNPGFQFDLAQKRYLSAIENHAPLLQLNTVPNLNNRSSRLQYLQNHPTLAINEPGLYSQLAGEQFWQDFIWNCNSRYIIEPLNWPAFPSYTPSTPIAPYDEITLLFPCSAYDVVNILLIYQEYVYAQRKGLEGSQDLLLEARSLFKNLSYSQQQKILGVYGTPLLGEILD